MAASTRAGSKRSYQLGIYRAGSRDVRHDRAIGHPRLEVLERRSDRGAVQQRFKPRACLRIRTWRRCKDRPPSPSLDRNSRKTRHDKLRGCSRMPTTLVRPVGYCIRCTPSIARAIVHPRGQHDHLPNFSWLLMAWRHKSIMTGHWNLKAPDSRAAEMLRGAET